jgi:hypothetical protein
MLASFLPIQTLKEHLMISKSLLMALVLSLGCLLGTQALQAGKDNELSAKELAALKSQRTIANDFMRQATEVALKNMKKGTKEKSAKEKSPKELLQEKLARKHYFDSGIEVKDLTEFARLVKEADKAGIKLKDEALQELIKASVLQLVDEKAIKMIEEDVRKRHDEATSKEVRDALSAEFRVRIIRDLQAKKK